MLTLRYRSVAMFASGIAAALVVAVVFVGVRSFAAPNPSESTFVPIAPCRLFDYRPAPDTVGTRTSPLGPAETFTQQVTGAVGNCNIPSGITGVSLNVTGVGGTANSNLAIYPADLATPPSVSSLNWTAGTVAVANKVDVKVSPGGALNLVNAFGSVYVLADVVGYYTNTGLTDLQAQLDSLKLVTETYSGYAMATRGDLANIQGSANGCAVGYDNSSNYLAIDIPTGASIESVVASVYDTSGATTYTVTLYRQVTSPTGLDQTPIATATGGALSVATIDQDLTPVDEVADPGEAFVVYFNDGTSSFGNGLCSVTVRYRRA